MNGNEWEANVLLHCKVEEDVIVGIRDREKKRKALVHLYRYIRPPVYACVASPLGALVLASIRVILSIALERTNSGRVRPCVTMTTSETNI